MINSIAGNSSLGFLSKASMENFRDVEKGFYLTNKPKPMGSSELPQMVTFNREILEKAKNDVKSGNYYPGKYVNILA